MSASHGSGGGAAHGASIVEAVGPHGPMQMLGPILEWVVAGINVVGVLVLVWGVAVGIVGFLRIEAKRFGGGDLDDLRVMLRRGVGYYLLLALELLIAADIIETMIKPTLSQLALLAGVVLIRIATSYSLGKELGHGHRPRDGAEKETGG